MLIPHRFRRGSTFCLKTLNMIRFLARSPSTQIGLFKAIPTKRLHKPSMCRCELRAFVAWRLSYLGASFSQLSAGWFHLYLRKITVMSNQRVPRISHVTSSARNCFLPLFLFSRYQVFTGRSTTKTRSWSLEFYCRSKHKHIILLLAANSGLSRSYLLNWSELISL